MEGIEILSQTPITDMAHWCQTTIDVLAVIVLVSLVAFGVSTFTHKEILIWICGGSAIFFWICGIILTAINPQVPTDRYEYKVTIEDNVSIADVYDNYEVTGRDGEIWILEDKE